MRPSRYHRTMPFDPFKLEHFFARWEFVAPHVLCASDAEGVPLRELLALADEETARLWADLKLGYTETLGHPLLRAEIARLYDGVAADDVVVFSGAQEPIFIAMSVLEGNGVEVTRIPLDHGQEWRLDPGRIAAAITSRTRLIVLSVPNSPTGALPDRAAFAAVAELAGREGTILFCDEVYRWLEYHPADRLPAGVETSDRSISLGVMSKAFGLAGLRIGWIACRDAAVRERVAALKHYTTICSSAPSEILALVALRARERLLARTRGIVSENLAHLDRFFRDWAGVVEWVRPRAGTVGFPRFLGDASVDEIARELVETRGVLILPGSIFDWPGNHFRIGFGRSDMPQSLARFEDYLRRR